MKDVDEKRIIEAALFVSAKSLSLTELKELTGIAALGYIKKMMASLQKEYDERGSAIEIMEMNGRYEMRARNQYIDRVKQFAQDSEISKAALRTLAYISKNDGVLKSTLAKRIGSQIYQDVKELTENDFVRSEKAGRTSKLFLTDKFKKYFSTE